MLDQLSPVHQPKLVKVLLASSVTRTSTDLIHKYLQTDDQFNVQGKNAK